MKRLSAWNINFDSLITIEREWRLSAIGQAARDPAFMGALDRYQSLADEYKIPMSLYFIGKDLETSYHADRVRDLHQAGHEIGNHSYTHPSNFSHLPALELEREVTDTHKIITNVTGGHEPKGFIAPGWNLSKPLVHVLKGLNYEYDSSLFPSFMMPVMQFLLVTQKLRGRFKEMPLLRKDLIGNIIGNTHPYYLSVNNVWGTRPSSQNDCSLLSLPLPVFRPRIGFWHSWAFKGSRRSYERRLRNAIKNCPHFYLLTHPFDLFDPEKDMKGLPSSILSFERMDVPIAFKTERMRIALDILTETREVVTMQELARSEKTRLEARGAD